jgi:hypothetical protein
MTKVASPPRAISNDLRNLQADFATRHYFTIIKRLQIMCCVPVSAVGACAKLIVRYNIHQYLQDEYGERTWNYQIQFVY